MELSPWHLSRDLNIQQVAALLGGFDIAAIWAGYIGGDGWHTYNEWRRVILEAARRGDLKPNEVQVLTTVGHTVHPISDGRDIKVPTQDWMSCKIEDLAWEPGQGDGYVKISFERKEIFRWLKDGGFDVKDIPEAIRIMPKVKAAPSAKEKPVHHKKRNTYLTIIEGLVLELMGDEIPDEPYKAAGMLQSVLQVRGLKLNDDTVANVVKEIQTAREDRDSDPFF